MSQPSSHNYSVTGRFTFTGTETDCHDAYYQNQLASQPSEAIPTLLHGYNHDKQRK